jgi:ribosome-associated toxin RatA of RatAB toxin-antitoxin module
MPNVAIDTLVPGADPDAVYARLRDFAAYPRYTDAVREVRVTDAGPDTVDSQWSVNFRTGVLRWGERDTFDPAARTIAFTQTSGDFDEFSGTWRVEPAGGAVAVRFACEFDLGMPSLAAMIDPIAAESLTENLRLILRGLLGDEVTFTTTGAAVA